MNRRILCVMALPCVMGCVMASDASWLAAAVSAVMAVYLLYPAFLVLHGADRVLRIVLVAGSFCAGYLAFSQSMARAEAETAVLTDKAEASEIGVVTGRQHGGGALFLEHTIVYWDGAKQIPIGARVRAEGIVYLFEEATNEGQFDSRRYGLSRGFTHALYVPSEREVTVLKPPRKHWRERLFALAEAMENVYQSCLPADIASVVSAAAAGDKRALDDEISGLFQRSGISHILVVSGLHVSLIGMGLYRLMRRSCPILLSAFAAASAVFLYGQMTGFAVSAARAVWMFLIFLGAAVLGRSYDGLSALSLVLLVMVLQNPFLIYASGFVLSFYQTGMILLVSDALRGCEYEAPIRSRALFALLVPVMGYPVIASCFYEISLLALALNLLVLPLMGVVMYLAVFGGLAGCVFLPLGAVLLYPVRLVLGADIALCRAFEKLPFGVVVCGKPGALRLTLCFAILAVLLCVLQKKRAGSLGVAAAASVLLVVVLGFPQQKTFEVDLLDVGQGDGIYICSEEGLSMFIDGGSSNVSGLGRYRLMPFFKAKGVRGIDYWFLSHLDRDHISGFLECVEEGCVIRHVVLAADILRDDVYDALCETLDAAGIETIYLEAGDRLRFTDTEIRCIGPSDAVHAMDRNARSLVLLYQDSGFSGFFAGDISEEEERLLLQSGALSKVDLYKASHHGSNYSNSEAVLEALSPLLCVISAGKDNRYGHPGSETLQRLRAQGIPVLVTIENGRIRIRKPRGYGGNKKMVDKRQRLLYDSWVRGKKK